jgi:hypothetical protein
MYSILEILLSPLWEKISGNSFGGGGGIEMEERGQIKRILLLFKLFIELFQFKNTMCYGTRIYIRYLQY